MSWWICLNRATGFVSLGFLRYYNQPEAEAFEERTFLDVQVGVIFGSSSSSGEGIGLNKTTRPIEPFCKRPNDLQPSSSSHG